MKITTEDYIKSCKLIHGDEYDYSKTIYQHSLENVIVICKKHGEFLIKASKHKSSKGKCKFCLTKCVRTKSEYIELFNKIYNFAYEYPISQEFHSHKKLNIICKIHGLFSIRFNCHVKGQGCGKCNIDQYKITEHEKVLSLIKSNNFIIGIYHNDVVYSYKFFCVIHGEYYKSPQLIRQGFMNCSKCSANAVKHVEFYKKYLYEKTKGSIMIDTKEEFPIKSKKYTFICEKHGKFDRRLDSILKHTYCKKCGTNAKIDKEAFIKRANKIHENIFNYEKIIYIDYNSPMEIICEKHGSFWQSPNAHLAGSGCQKCKSSSGEKSVRKILNILNIDYVEQKKFKNCRNILPLKFDFYLQNYSLVIEYNGLQHYQPVKWSSNDTDEEAYKRFNYIRNNDNLKKEYCRLNGIEYLEISYKEKNDIQNIILRKINLLTK